MNISPLEKSIRPIPRTLDEAYRTPTYASAIQKFPSDTQHTLNFLPDILVGMFLGACVVIVIYLVGASL